MNFNIIIMVVNQIESRHQIHCDKFLYRKYHQELCSFYHTAGSSYHHFAPYDITQIFYTSAFHHMYLCINPSSVECYQLHTRNAKALFLYGNNALLIMVVCHLHVCHLHVHFYPIMVGISKLALADNDPQFLADTTTMHITS